MPITVRGGGLSTKRVHAESLREGRSAYARLAMTLDERASSWGFTLPPRETFEVHTLKSTLDDTLGGSSMPLCMRIMTDAGLKNESCTTVQFPIDFTKYWFVAWSKNF